MNRPRLAPTPAGWAFAALLAALFLMAVNYSNNLIFALVFLLGATAALSTWQTWRNLTGLTVHVGEPAPVFAGEVAALPVTVLATAGGTRYGLTVRARGATGYGGATRAELTPGTACRLALPLACPTRGWRAVIGVRVVSRYPLGLLEARLDCRHETRALVWPAPAVAAPIPACTASGEEADSFAGLRTWLPGESPRRIAWKAFARRGDLLARGFDGADGAHATTLEWAATDGDDDARLAILARLVLDAEAAGLDYALHLPGRHLPAGRGEAQRHACLAALALFDAADPCA